MKSMTDRDDFENEEPVNLTAEEQRQVILDSEDDILAALLKAADFREDPDELTEIEVARSGQTLFKFRIHPLSEEEILKCRKDNTSYKKNRATGVRTAESVNTPRYRSQVIYTATLEEDRVKLWDNRAAWKKLNVLNGIDLVDAVLKGGEKARIYDKVEEISGYADEGSEEEAREANAKN